MTDKAAVEAMMQEIVDSFGQIDILVNNAGGMLHAPPNNSAVTAPPDHYQYIMDINLTGTIFCCQAAAPHMQAARSGKIVNTRFPGRHLEWSHWLAAHGLQSRQSGRDPLHAGPRSGNWVRTTCMSTVLRPDMCSHLGL